MCCISWVVLRSDWIIVLHYVRNRFGPFTWNTHINIVFNPNFIYHIFKNKCLRNFWIWFWNCKKFKDDENWTGIKQELWIKNSSNLLTSSMGQIAFCLHLHDGQIDWNWFQIDLKVSCEQGAILKKKTSLLLFFLSQIIPALQKISIACTFWAAAGTVSYKIHIRWESVIDSFYDENYIQKNTGSMWPYSTICDFVFCIIPIIQ